MVRFEDASAAVPKGEAVPGCTAWVGESARGRLADAASSASATGGRHERESQLEFVHAEQVDLLVSPKGARVE